MFGSDEDALIERYNKAESLLQEWLSVNSDKIALVARTKSFLENEPQVAYDCKFGDDRICECGHTYYRHFDTYKGMAPVGCKYCGCERFKENNRRGTR